MSPISRLPLQASRISSTTALSSLKCSRLSERHLVWVARSPAFAHPFRTVFTKTPSRKAEPAATPTQSSRVNTSQSPSPNEPIPAPNTSPNESLKLQEENTSSIDWTRSFHGLSIEPFSKEAADVLMAPLSPDDVEIKPDGIIFLPEIKYRRILNRAFGPGGWGLAPRGETIVTEKAVTREYALLAHGRLVSIARGEQDYFNKDGVPTASEGCKSNAMMRCCKDLGVASELWDPRFIRKFKSEHCREVFVEHQGTKKRTKIWLRKVNSSTWLLMALY
ncbi:mitochondrial genome maintenance MGM101-domain-containing protein [Exophiala viscosa]|uniref:Mitochondrial genome maintenance protein MGM101 n=1 Tax=Exophiala viscosa TaxID=2486360 RepID=A0AAN6E982_9EURO|nr:mitochondrial genome maintenance MGM101-domain-containing protein [Exophiala viscosa]